MNYHNVQTMHFNKVSLRVKDIDKMLYFYQNVLGFTLNKVNGNFYYLGTKNNSFLTLISNPNLIASKSDALYHIAYLLPNRSYLGQFLHSLLEKNIKIGASDHGFSEALYFNDPEGNGIEVYSDIKGFDIKGETPLFAQKLNLDNLLKIRVKKSFKTIPLDTLIGHIHLHVKDLNNATNFYHHLLGFNIIFNWNQKAIFLSDHNYHHHIAYNIWDDFTIDFKKYTGLDSMSLNIPKTNYDKLISSLKIYNIPIQKEKNIPYIRDVNNIKIFLDVI